MKSRPKKSKIITRYFTRFASLISGFDIKIMVLMFYISLSGNPSLYIKEAVIVRLLTLIMFMPVWRYSLPSALL